MATLLAGLDCGRRIPKRREAFEKLHTDSGILPKALVNSLKEVETQKKAAVLLGRGAGG